MLVNYKPHNMGSNASQKKATEVTPTCDTIMADVIAEEGYIMDARVAKTTEDLKGIHGIHRDGLVKFTADQFHLSNPNMPSGIV